MSNAASRSAGLSPREGWGPVARWSTVGCLFAGALTLASGMLACGGSTESTPPAPDPAPSPLRAPAAAAERPHVIVLLWDTTRADRLSLYGHSRPTTPRLDALASDARVYEQAQSPGMWTVPSHASMFTGLPAPSHGAKVGWLWLDGHHLTLAEHFGAHGYQTFAWSANPYLAPATNLLQGFDEVRLTWLGDDATVCAKATNDKLIPRDASVSMAPAWAGGGEGWPEHLTVTKECAPQGVDAVLEALDEADGPVFAYLNLLEAHHPRLPSLASRRAVASPEMVEAGLQTDGSLRRLMGAMEGMQQISEADRDALLSVYDASLRDLDAATGRLVDGLTSRGLLDDTVLVVVGDHGEHFGEDGMYDHRWSVHQALLHVPLVIRYPKAAPPARVSEPVSTRGLFGTLPALAGLPAPAVDHPLATLDPPGPVFSALVAPTPRLPMVLSTWPGLDPERWRRRYQVVVDWPHKLVRDDRGGRWLYDLAVDPMQSSDLAPVQAQRADQLEGALKRWQRELPRYDRRKRSADDRPGRPMEQDADTRAMLEALGYTSP